MHRRPHQRPHGAAAHKLQNGDIVEIVTQAGHKPSRDWLGFVVTSRARSKIRHVIQGEERERSVELGRRLFDKEARRFGLNPATMLDSSELPKFASEYGARTPEELLAHIGYGKLSARTVLQKSVPAELKEKAPDSAVVSVVKRVLRPGAGADKIKVRGTDDIMVFRAKCCNPIRGEKIVGYITRGKGVSVHSASCPNVLNLMFDPERRIDVEWDTAGGDAPYTVRLTMQVEDRKGMLAEISAKVSDINTNITNMQARTGDDQQARIDMTVEIRDVKHLDKVIKSIKGVQGVLGVERTARCTARRREGMTSPHRASTLECATSSTAGGRPAPSHARAADRPDIARRPRSSRRNRSCPPGRPSCGRRARSPGPRLSKGRTGCA